MNHPLTSHRRRPGTAPLEFVLALPFLVGLAAAIFLIAEAGKAKGEAAVAVRSAAWRKPTPAAPSSLRPTADPAPGMVGADVRRKFQSKPPLPRVKKEAISAAYLPRGSWDQKVIPFERRSGVALHEGPLKKVASGVPGVNLVTRALTLPLDPSANAALGGAGNAAAALQGPAQVAAAVLKTVISPVLSAARPLVELARKIASATRQKKLAERLGRVVGMIDVAVGGITNLYEASRGRSGKWDPQAALKLYYSIP